MKSLTHSCPDVTDVNGKTPVDLATEQSTAAYLNQDQRKVYTEIINYFKSLPIDCKSLLHHS